MVAGELVVVVAVLVVVCVCVVGVVGVVAEVVVVCVCVMGAVGVVAEVVVSVAVGEVGALDVVALAARWRQSLSASRLTAVAPWVRLLRNVALTDEGRLLTALLSAAAAFDAAPQSPASIALDT